MTTSNGGSTRRDASGRKKNGESEGGDSVRKHHSISRSSSALNGERTVKRLRLSRALTVPENTSIYDACRKMASRKVDALLLTDSNALLCGILTDKDMALRVIAREVNLTKTPVSRVMTRNPVFVLSDTLAVEALQKMVQGKFRHLPVVENGEVIALLDIAKCLYDAIARMERASEKGKAIAAAVEGVEKHWGTYISGPNTFVEMLRDRMFSPSLSTILPDNSKLVTVSPTDSVLVAAKKMLDFRASCAVVSIDKKPQGILTSRDILMRVIAQDLSPESTTVEKVMTPNPECATTDTPLVDALHTMHDGKFLHLPVVNRDGVIVATVDVIHITHAAVATVGNTAGIADEATSTMIQNFWDSAMALSHHDDEDTRSDGSLKLVSESEAGRSVLDPSFAPNLFSFKVEDRRGRMHRFNCETKSMKDLMAVIQKLGTDIDRRNMPQILYEDEDHDKVVLESDDDLAAAVDHARLIGLKGLRLHLEYPSTCSDHGRSYDPAGHEFARANTWGSAYYVAAAGIALAAGVGILTYLKKGRN
uniref:Uncharacterized protein n=1 Tax=Kalanchoe fedtschenkoi TaxID=63787 RepID=A0A7N0UHK8_KALFE